jgi:hypothetical protein
MRLPKFWKDSGHANDRVVTLSITFCLLAWLLLAWWFGGDTWVLACGLLAPFAGFLLGITLVALLSTFFRVEDK